VLRLSHMTVVLGQQFLQGVILMADCRASIQNGGSITPWRDNTQKVFFLDKHLIIGFAGDIDTAGSIIAFLGRQVHDRPKLGNIHIFARKAPALIKYAYEELSQNKKVGDVAFIVAGVDFNRPERVLDVAGKVTGHMPSFDRKVFKLSSPDFLIHDTSVLESPIAIIGSGTPALTEELEKSFKGLQFSFALAGSLAISATTISGILMSKAREVGIESVGGLMQIAVIENSGSGFVPYKSRSDSHKGPHLDLELSINADGRFVQKNLITGAEVLVLSPPEVVQIKDPAIQLFADLETA